MQNLAIDSWQGYRYRLELDQKHPFGRPVHPGPAYGCLVSNYTPNHTQADWAKAGRDQSYC